MALDINPLFFFFPLKNPQNYDFCLVAVRKNRSHMKYLSFYKCTKCLRLGHVPYSKYSTYTEICFVQNRNLQISFKKKRTFAWSFSQFCELFASTVYFTCYFIVLSKSKARYMKILEGK